MESTNTTRAPSVRAWCSIASSRVSPSPRTAPASTVNRSARSRIWSGDSSPDTYSAGTPACSSRAAHCSRSVDLPIPGSPPTSTTEPGTMPPPRTKSNSPRPVRQRSLPTVGRLESWTGTAVSFQPSNRSTFFPTGSSTSEFHAPQLSQRPPHFGWSAPHSVQRKTDLPLDTPSLERSFARSVVVEARVLFLEMELHSPRGAVALLADDHLGDAFDALVRLRIDGAVVELLPVDETDDVGVLFDRPRLTEIRELRPPVLAAALFRRARELRDGDDRN